MLDDTQINQINDQYATTGQIQESDLPVIQDMGFKTVICFRPEEEDADTQPNQLKIKEKLKSLGIEYFAIPVIPGYITPDNIHQFKDIYNQSPKPVLGHCRSGNRAIKMFEAIQNQSRTHQADACNWTEAYDVVVIGGGAGGIGVAASLLKRRKALRIALVEPNEYHYYQPSWTLVGAGAYQAKKSQRLMSKVMPKGVDWIRASVTKVDPEKNQILLNDQRVLPYVQLIVAPGLVLDWEAIQGLKETLGKNGVTSNYDFEHAQYTWELVKNLKMGKAIFTQPPMPIKCAGAPQKAMYLSSSYWEKQKKLGLIDVEFNNAGPVLFGVAEFVPPLMEYVNRYDIRLNFNSNLVEVDGKNKVAYFESKKEDGSVDRIKKDFDMLHVVPPQKAPTFVKESNLSDDAGWLDVNQVTLQHKKYPNIFGVGDVINSPNAKTAAAARKQIVVVANNLIASKELREMTTKYDGYGACPLTVEYGKVVLAEFGFGGRLLPTFPLNPTVARRFSWFLKAVVMPWLYWNLMLKGIEWLAKPKQD